MPKASVVAAELRNLADRLDASPDTVIEKLFITRSHYSSTKNEFLDFVKLMPRPLKKGTADYGLSSGPELTVAYEGTGINIHVTIPQSATCTLITPARPAVYDCNPILSAEDEAEIEATHAD